MEPILFSSIYVHLRSFKDRDGKTLTMTKIDEGLTCECANVVIWGWVKTLVPSEPQNSWDLWMFIPLKMVSIGIDPYPFVYS